MKLNADEQALSDRLVAAAGFLADHYFRAKVVGHDDDTLKKIFQSGVVIANHSGMAFPWDSIILCEQMRRFCPKEKPYYPLNAPQLDRISLMHVYGIKQFWSLQCYPATKENVENLVADNFNIIMHPEGIAGIGKGFDKRYQLQRFASSIVRSCLKHDRPLIPVCIVNGEYLHPYAYNFPFLTKIIRFFGIPFLPIGPMTIPFLIFPWIFYMALPAQLTYVVGEQLDLRNMLRKITNKDVDNLNAKDFRELTSQVQNALQENLNQAVAKYGTKPYGSGNPLTAFSTLGWKAIMLFPIMWPLLFHFAHLGPAATKCEKIRSSLICIALSIPILGWPLYLLLVFATKSKIPPAQLEH